MDELSNTDIEALCRDIARDMCTHPKYGIWLEAAFTQTDSRWYSVVAEVAKQGCPTSQIEKLPKEVIRDFVYICIKAPRFKINGEVLFLFKLADSIWSQLISSTPSKLLLDVSGIMDEETFHEFVSKKLNFPGYYGFNLAAFWDCITDPDQSSMPQKLIVEGLAALRGYLPDLHDAFVECLRDYSKLYPEREVVFLQDSPSGSGLDLEED